MIPDPNAPSPEDQRKINANAGHIPGHVHTAIDGTQYKVSQSGAWIRITPRRHEK